MKSKIKYSISDFCSSEGKSIVLLNAITRNEVNQVNNILKSITTLKEFDKIIDSIYIQQSGKVIAGPLDLIEFASNNEQCSSEIVALLVNRSHEIVKGQIYQEKTRHYSLTEPMESKAVIDIDPEESTIKMTSIIGEVRAIEE